MPQTGGIAGSCTDPGNPSTKTRRSSRRLGGEESRWEKRVAMIRGCFERMEDSTHMLEAPGGHCNSTLFPWWELGEGRGSRFLLRGGMGHDV